MAPVPDRTNDTAIAHRIASDLAVDPSFERSREIDRRVAFLADALTGGRRACLVLGVSGGIDSAVTGRLCQLAVERVRRAGSEAVFVAMRLPYGVQRDEQDAQTALAFIEPDEVMSVDIRPVTDACFDSLLASGITFGDAREQDFVLGNVKARQRMTVQYAVANARRGLVVGTDHAAEAITGFFTKFGDGAADVVPLTGLTKRRVRAIGQALGAPDVLITKTPTADLESLRPGHPDEAAYGFTYDDIDDFLEGRPVPAAIAEAIRQRYETTAHKRRLPVAPTL